MVHNRFNEIYPKEGIIDSGATSHFLPMTYKGTNEKITATGIKVGCANGSIMESKATDMLDLPSLPEEARSCHKFHEIQEPLISVKRLVQSGCSVHFVGEEVLIKDTSTGEVRLQGQYCPQRHLYTLPLHEEHPIQREETTVPREKFTDKGEEQPTYDQPHLRDILSTIEAAYGAFTYE